MGLFGVLRHVVVGVVAVKAAKVGRRLLAPRVLQDEQRVVDHLMGPHYELHFGELRGGEEEEEVWWSEEEEEEVWSEEEEAEEEEEQQQQQFGEVEAQVMCAGVEQDDKACRPGDDDDVPTYEDSDDEDVVIAVPVSNRFSALADTGEVAPEDTPRTESEQGMPAAAHVPYTQGGDLAAVSESAMPASSAGDSFIGTIPESEEVDHGGLDESDDDDCDETNAHVEAFVDEVDIPSTKDEQDYITVSEYVREGPFTWHTLWEPMSRPGCDDESWSRFAQGMVVHSSTVTLSCIEEYQSYMIGVSTACEAGTLDGIYSEKSLPVNFGHLFELFMSACPEGTQSHITTHIHTYTYRQRILEMVIRMDRDFVRVTDGACLCYYISFVCCYVSGSWFFVAHSALWNTFSVQMVLPEVRGEAQAPSDPAHAENENAAARNGSADAATVRDEQPPGDKVLALCWPSDSSDSAASPGAATDEDDDFVFKCVTRNAFAVLADNCEC